MRDDDESIESEDIAELKVSKLLEIFGIFPSRLKYSTDKIGLRAGQVQTVNLSIFNISNKQFLFESVTISFPTFEYAKYTINALEGENEVSWVEFFSAWANAGRKFTFRENELLRLIKNVYDGISISDVLTDSENDSVVLMDALDDPYTATAAGTFSVPVTGELVGRGIVGYTKVVNPPLE